MGGQHADISAHDLNAAQLTAKSAALVQYKALGAHGCIHLAVSSTWDVQHFLVAYIKLTVAHLTVKHVDGRRAKEFGNEQIGRVVVHLLRLADLLDHSVLHDHDAVRDAHGLVLVVGHEHGCNAGLPLNSLDLLTGLQAQAGVKVGKGLVQQQNAGHFDQCPGNGNSLLLTARQLGRLAVHKAVYLHQLCDVVCLLLHLLTGHLGLALEIFQREGDVLQYSQMGIQSIVLEHQTHAATLGGQLGDVVLSEEYFTLGGAEQSADEIERGALAASGGTQQAYKLAVGYFKRKIVYSHNVCLTLFASCGEFFRYVLQYNFHKPFSFYPRVRREDELLENSNSLLY